MTVAAAFRRAPRRTALALVVLGLAAAGCAAPGDRATAGAEPPAAAARSREEPFVKRAFRPFIADRWIGNGIAYGPYRDGQSPGGLAPSRHELREDLRLMARHWRLLRLYGATGPSESILQILREEGLEMRVLLGAWIGVEERRDSSGALIEAFPETREANRRELDAAVRLAAAYPELVVGVSVGNETQVSWSAHRVPAELLVGYLREARARIAAPVTTADDYAFWTAPESRAVADEVDFIVTHAHPLWNGLPLEGALDWTRNTLERVRAAHPGHEVALGETGWATRRHDEGEQARLIRGRVGEAEQAAFLEALNAWVERERVTTFFFEAFDENWKGGPHPDEVEKHWGLYRADRSPKRALAAGD